MKYTIEDIKDLIEKCDSLIDIFREARDAEPCIQTHNDLIYFLSRRRRYVSILERKNVIH